MAALIVGGVMLNGILLSPAQADPMEGDAVILRALDKVTARTSDLEIPIGEYATFGSLTILPQKCLKRPPEETPETTAFLEITEHLNSADMDAASHTATARIITPAETPAAAPSGEPLPPPSDSNAAPPVNTENTANDQNRGIVRLFTGWMFASSPAINALEHPVYDVWVIDCKISDPDKPSGKE
jgi:hypothetical protein